MSRVKVYSGSGFDKYPIGYIENGKIYKCSSGLFDEKIGEYEGFADGSCISLLVCNFDEEISELKSNTNYDYSLLDELYSKKNENTSSSELDSKEFNVLERLIILVIVLILIFIALFMIKLLIDFLSSAAFIVIIVVIIFLLLI